MIELLRQAELFESVAGWRTVRLGEVCRQDRVIVEPSDPRAADLPYLGLEHIESQTGRILTDMIGLDDTGKSTTFAFDSRHILYGKLRPYLNKVATPDFAGRCTTELVPLLPCDGVSRDYLAWLLRRPQTVAAAMREKTGAQMPRANMEYVLSQEVAIPNTLADQQRAADLIAQRMALVAQAKAAAHDQLRLLDEYAHMLMADFGQEQADD